MSTIITLCTDFGQRDGYVGAMKGVILAIAPRAILVDISHDIAPQSVIEGAFVLSTACEYFPQGVIHLVVVDPGVGTSRRLVAVRTDRHVFVAPDNGVLGYALRHAEIRDAVVLSNRTFWRAEVSRTFHGRDILAPVAAHAANGVPLAELGEPAGRLQPLALADARVRDDGTIVGCVVHVDRFGNVITNIPSVLLQGQAAWAVKAGGERIQGLAQTYADVRPGQIAALIGSQGALEIAVREGNAAQATGLGVGGEVEVTPLAPT